MVAIWPEFHQLKILRLENCTFDPNETLSEILPKMTTELQSLSLFAVMHPFRNNILPSFLADTLEELWIEHCWPLLFEHHFASYGKLRSLHVDWFLFAVMGPLFPQNVLSLSVSVPGYVASSAPDFDRFEAELEQLSVCRPSLQVVRVTGMHGLPLLGNEVKLRRNLSLQNVDMIIETVNRGKREHFFISTYIFC